MTTPIDLFAPEVRGDPYPTYAVLRDGPPRQVAPGDMWAVTRHEDVMHALKHPELFSSAGFEALFKPAWLRHNPLADSILTMDGTGHTRLRGLVSRAFTPRGVARLDPRIRRIVSECADALRDREELEFVEDFAIVVPGRVIAEILGLDPALHREFRSWIDDIASISPWPPPEDVAERIRRTVTELEGYLREVVSDRRRSPREDMVTDLVQAEVEGATLTDEDLVAFLFILLPAGFETTRHFFANAMLAFTARPDDFTALRAKPEAIPAWVEELLRYEPPVHGVFRLTTQDVEVAGQTIPRGSMVWLLLGSANRDEAAFDAAGRFDPSRGKQASLTFGHGSHFCLGAPLARLEACLGIEALASRFTRFERTREEVSWNVVPTVRGPNALYVRAFTE